jgi:putative ABC transport system permease protein
MGERVRTFAIRALLAHTGPARALDGNFAIMDIAAAQVALGRLGFLDRLDVRLNDGGRIDALEREIADRLPAGLSVQRPARRGAQVEKMLAAFHFNLTALSYIALIVGLFLVYNTVSVSVIARREEIGVLRALGTTRRRVLTLFLGEAAMLATAGCAIGLAIGRGLAFAAVDLTKTAVSTLYVAAAAIVPPLSWADAALAFGVGVPLSLAAAAAPALEASRVSPLAAVRGSARAEARGRFPWRSLGSAALLFAAGAVLSQLEPVGGLPVFGLGAAIAIVFGGACLVPATLGLLARSLRGALTRMFAAAGRLAHANLAGSIARLSVSVAALAVSLSMMVAIAIMIGSFRETVSYWVAQTLQADLYVSPVRRSGQTRDTAIAADVPYADGTIGVAAGDFAVGFAHSSLLFKAPADGRETLRQAIGRNAVVISEPLAMRHKKAVGDRLTLPTAGGPVEFDVLSIYFDYASERGFAVMDRATFVRHFGEAPPASLTVYLRDGADAERVRRELVAAVPAEHRILVHTNASLRREVLRIFDSTFAVTYALEAIAIFVAILGVAGTLLTLVLERRRELSMLRLVGAGRRHIRTVVMIEAGVIGGVSQALGLLVGLGLSLILIYVINVQSFGWTIQFHLPVGFLVQSSMLVLAATILSGLYPARIAGRLATIDQVVEE